VKHTKVARGASAAGAAHAATGRLKELRSCDDTELDLAMAALDIACISPGTGQRQKTIDPYVRHLDILAKDVGVFAGRQPDVETAAHALGQILGKRYGYGGNEDTYDDLTAANLMAVIDDRAGLPVALGILYIHSARAQGWLASGIDFPGRFMVRIEIDGERAILNPFDGGAVMQTHDLRDVLKLTMGNDVELAPEHYRELGNRGILMRLENNLKVRHLHAQEFDAALRVIDTMLLFSPAEASLWREAGMIHVRLEQIDEAITALEEYLRLDTDGPSRYTATVLLQELRQRPPQ
jgi:regulator of sirC expression with transglutaminase-like and TPR domain